MDIYAIVRQDLAQNGFNPEEIIGDGKLRRFKVNANDKNPDAWIVCYLNKTHRGDEFLAGSYGDWHFDSTHNFCTNISLTSKEKEVYYAKARKAFDQECLKKWEETSVACTDFWNNFTETEGLHEYLIRKKIQQLHGARLADRGAELLIPVKDFNQKIWGFQKIYGDGTKRFQPGTKKAGNFFQLGDIQSKETIYLCEGFATGVSVYEAIEKPVLVCFDAGNLVSVARLVREKFPECILIVCGDDDIFTENNPGKLKAQEAASAGLGTAIFPVFKNRSEKQTDFNDLAMADGLEILREQILGAEGKKFYVNALGFRGSSYFYTSSENLQIVEINGHTETDLLKLMPEDYWKSQYSNKGRIIWSKAKSDLMAKCRAKGIFVQQKVRGNGLWFDRGRVIVHLGDRLFYDQDFRHLHSLDSDYFYELDQRLQPVNDRPLSVAELSEFRSLLSSFNYVNLQQYLYLGCWMALAPICGILPWRPHLWLTGEPGSGKSTVKDFVDSYLDFSFRHLSVTGSSTEAGVRQTLKAAAIPLTFDEFEPEGRRAAERVESFLELCRLASSEGSGNIIKGGAGGEPTSYGVRFMALLGSVKPRLIAEADKSRFTYIELDKSKQSNTQWNAIRKALRLMTEEFAERLFSRVVGMSSVILKNAQTFREAFVETGATQRIGQQYGTLLAGWEALQSDSEISLADAIDTVRNIKLEDEDSVSEYKDQEECLDYLLNSFVRFENTQHLLKTLINAGTETVLHKEIHNYGMKIVAGNLFIKITNTQVDRIFQGSKWGPSWKQILKRLDGVKRRTTARIQHKVEMGITIPSIYFNQPE